MATPDLRSLYELYRQIYGGQGNSVEPAQQRTPESPRYPKRAYDQQSAALGGNDNYARAGGVLGGSVASPAGTPWWAQQSAIAGGPSFAVRPPVSVRPRPGPFPIPIPSGPNAIPEIPNPHIERLVPETTRNFWIAATLLPWMLGRGMIGERPDGSSRAPNEGPSPIEKPPNRGGSTPPWIMGPAVLEEERRRSAPSGDTDPSERPDPNFRQLTRVASDSEAKGVSGAKPGRRPTPKVESPPLAPDQERSYWRDSLEETLREMGGAGGGSGDGGDPPNGGDDYCSERWGIEQGRCFARKKRSKKWKYLQGCLDRTTERQNMCVQNGGRPSLSEKPEWGRDDER